MKLPTFEMVIDEQMTSDVEVADIAFVDKPAIEKNFLRFKDDRLHFVTDEERRIVSGPAMVADQLIYRRDDNGEYNVFFSKDTIEKIAVKFFKKGYQKNMNLFHDPNMSVEGVTIFESFVSDESRGIKPMAGYEDLPDGSWFISVKVENDDVWNRIKSGEVKGFSVEGIFSYIKKPKSVEESMAELLSGTLKGSPLFTETAYMSLLDDLKKLKEKFLGEMPVEPAATPDPVQKNSDVQLKDGRAASVTEMAPGGVFTVDGVPAPAGEYELADGSKVVVGEGGVIDSIVPANAPVETPVADYSSQFAEINEKFNAYEAKFAEQSNVIKQLSDSFSKTNETIVHLVGIVEKMAQAPTADPVSTSGNNFLTQKAENKSERISSLMENLKKLKTA